MALFQVLGDGLEGSGWSSALVDANITKWGIANSMLGGGHVTRTRWAHQVTSARLSVLQGAVYQQYVDMHADDDDDLPTLCEWCKTESEAHQLEHLVLQFVRSVREGHFQLNVEILGKLVP